MRFSSTGSDCVEDGEEDSVARARAQHLEDIRRSAIPAICHMCGLKHPKHELTKVVNQRMMLETQHHMRKRGLDIFSFPHAGRLQLSCSYPVCSLCYSLYLAEKELIQAELDLAQALQQPLPHKDPTFFSFLGVLDAIQVRGRGPSTATAILTVHPEGRHADVPRNVFSRSLYLLTSSRTAQLS